MECGRDASGSRVSQAPAPSCEELTRSAASRRRTPLGLALPTCGSRCAAGATPQQGAGQGMGTDHSGMQATCSTTLRLRDRAVARERRSRASQMMCTFIH